MNRAKRRTALFVLLAVVLLAAAAAVWFFSSYTIIHGKVFSRQETVIDLRGTDITPEDALSLIAENPEKTVVWDVPLSDGGHANTETSVTVSKLCEDDVPLFSCFPSLEKIDARSCTDYAAILSLREAYPDIELRAAVQIGEKSAPIGTKRLVLPADTACDEITEKLAYLPELEEVIFTDGTVSSDEQDTLTAAFPSLSFRWNISLLGGVFSSADTEISFAGTSLTDADVQTLRENLFRFSSLERVDLTGCGLSEEQINTLRAVSDAVMVYEMEIYGQTVSTDAVELDFSNTYIGVNRVDEIESVLDRFPLLEKVVMCDCGIGNEDMAELNDRHEDVRFVWRVYFSEFSLRTDDTNFIAARVRNQYEIYSNDMEILKYCPDLQALDLGHKQITSLDFLRYVPHLKYLIIVEMDVNDITPIGELQELTYLEMFWTKCEDISPLKNCKNLTDLNISYVWCKAAKCLEVLSEMPQLERLWYCGNNMTDEQLEQLHAALPNTEMYLAQQGEPTGSTWREHEHYYEMRDFFGMYYMPGGTNGVDENGQQIIVTG